MIVFKNLEAEAINLDSYKANRDWIRYAWHFPPYKSKEFFKVVPKDMLDEFKKSMPYKYAVDKGLIKNDKWVG